VIRALATRFLPALLLGTLAACGGGGNGGSSILGGSQSPDPVVVDFPLVYVKRPLLLDDNGELVTSNVRNAVSFFPGAELILRDRASPTARETVLTKDLFPAGANGQAALIDVKDIDVSPDGKRLVFALRAPEIPGADPEDQPTWNIWLYDHTTKSSRRVIRSDLVAEEGDDIAPRFLPDGRILFASTRQRIAKAVLLDEGKPQFEPLDEDRSLPALALHVMDENGENITQITFNQSSDLDPAVLDDGRIVYSRWDNVAGVDRISLYSVRPDGRDNQVLYGSHSHDTGPNGQVIEFMSPVAMPDGRVLVLLRPRGDQQRMTALPVAINVDDYVEHDVAVASSPGLAGDAQELVIQGDLTLEDGRPPRQGRYASAAPLRDNSNRLVVSWSQCRLRDTASPANNPVITACTDDRLADAAFVEADPLYGVWMHDLDDDTAQPIVRGDSSFAYVEPVVMETRTAPPVLLDGTPGADLDADLVSANVGVVHIRSVYDIDGTSAANLPALADPLRTRAAQRPARFVRVVKSVAQPDDDVVDVPGTAFGVSAAQLMREVLGYAQVEPDGSVKVQVPANVPFWFDVLDGNGRRIGGRHNNWVQVRPGEAFECRGCHTAQSQQPHGRREAQATSANAGAPNDGLPWPNTEPALFADAGESMAEVRARIQGVPKLSVDLRYDDIWTDPNVRTKDVSFNWRYADLRTTAPVDAGCSTNWQSSCRIVLNYPTVIHPLWSVDRRVFDATGVNVVADNTCTTCHNVIAANGVAQVPAAQLDLSDGVSPDQADHLKSYRELSFNDNEQEVVNGVLQDRLVQAVDGAGNPQFQRDGQGNLILDANGNAIPVLVTVGVAPALSVVGANASTRFFSRFAVGGTHAGRLTPVELKLVSEWLDIGGQYYNNPFDVPQ
jgi:hypothetical protein